MPTTIANLIKILTALAATLAGAIVIWLSPAVSPWIAIPAFSFVPVFLASRRNQNCESKLPLPIGSSLVIGICAWVIGFIIVTQHASVDGATGPVQYAHSDTAKDIFALRVFASATLLLIPVFSVLILIPIQIRRRDVHHGAIAAAIVFYAAAVLCLITHFDFVPMV